ncbi:unnamed protein product, partial [Polarella glacialis]
MAMSGFQGAPGGPKKPGLWLPPSGSAAAAGAGGKGGKGLSNSMSLMEEMKFKQEKRDRRKKLVEELEALQAGGDASKIGRLRQELSSVEGFLAQTDGLQSLQSAAQAPQGPLACHEEKDTNNLYVGSLSPEWTEEQLSREFGRYGEITSIKIMYPRTDQQRYRGMNSGFVQFRTRGQAEAARSRLNGKEFFGMALRIDWGRAIQPIRNLSAVVIGGTSVASGLTLLSSHLRPALMPHLPEVHSEVQLALPAASNSLQPMSAAVPGERKSRWNLAKTMVVVFPEDKVLKKLIDKTAEFVASEGWDFEKLLLEREKDNPRFAFLSVEKENLEDPIHVYYRWRVFSFAQGDNEVFWRTEPYQVYENGPLWQAPSCEKPVLPEMPSQAHGIATLSLKGLGAAGGALESLQRKLTTGGVGSAAGGVGGAEMQLEDHRVLQELIQNLGPNRQSILKAMVFCLDNCRGSEAVATCICASITE